MISRKESAVTVHGVEARAFGVITADNGRIMNQRIAASRYYRENGHQYRITAELRFDDERRNGHETFSITADIREDGREYMGGCCHEEIAKHFPELAHLTQWHLVSTDGPLHYVANSMYHAREHGATHAWVYYTGAGVGDPLNLVEDEPKERLIGYLKADKAREAEGVPGYRVQWDEKTVKVANLDHARSSAIWPEATIEQLRDRAQLEARLPDLMTRFKADMLATGLLWPVVKEIA